ncbi:MAG: hypothetical protein PWQ20_1637 [Thermotogaceae bacterium]|jgi:hypothetical protein|nr:hypothetical protein [Thermotogaceae bacterium]MDI3495396.1 hypothetical protein [Pseudothermotoga sp.]MDN5338567.1 hypothetical protein [Thermotogaceae bacterium]
MLCLENPRIQLRLGRLSTKIRCKSYRILRGSNGIKQEKLGMLLISEAKRLQKEIKSKAENENS